jgi:hypothetical protein
MKKLFIAILAVAFGLAIAGAASADTDINVYGASAQFNFWSAQAGNWLTSATGGNCTGGATTSPASGITTISGLTLHGQKYFWAQGSTCGADTGAGKITVRVVAGDSVDGLAQVVPEAYPFDAKVPGGHLDPLICAAGTRTMMAGTGSLSVPASTDMSCYPVTLGASDVTPDLFTQQTTSAGSYFDGPTGSDVAWGPINLNGHVPNVGSLNHYQPVVVPFGIWLNSTVQLSTCTNSNNAVYTGSPCTANSQCGTSTQPGTCGAPANVTNISLDWVTQILGGSIYNWNDLNSAFSNEPIVICLRVPGSGTLATADYTFVKRATNVALPVAEAPVGGGVQPYVYFNFTSGDLEKCVNTEKGAIGILDADDSKVNGAGGYGPVALNGQLPTRQNIRTGLYDYFTIENLYEAAKCASGASPFAADCHAVVENFVNYANVPANITASGRNLYASSAEMLVWKTSTAYPAVRLDYQGNFPGAASLCTTGTGDAGDPLSNFCDTTCTGGGSCVQQLCTGTPAVTAVCP